LAVEFLAHALRGIAERRLEDSAVVGMAPRAHLVARERRLARIVAAQQRPVLVEVDAVVADVPVPEGEARARERGTQSFFRACHLLLGAAPQRAVGAQPG